MAARAFSFICLDDRAFAQGHANTLGGSVTLAVGITGQHQTTISLSPAEARAMANALYEAADFAEQALPTGLGESAVEGAPLSSQVEKALHGELGTHDAMQERAVQQQVGCSTDPDWLTKQLRGGGGGTMSDLERALLSVVRLGVDMRNRQSRYFKTRQREDLIGSKEAERAFDNAAREAMVAHGLPVEDGA